MSKKWNNLFIQFFLIIIISGSLSAQNDSTGKKFDQSWDDLFSDDKEIYGSEKDERYPINAYIYDLEKWEGHTSHKIFWLFKNKDYPKYKSTVFFPFYYHLQSKIDSRKKRIFYPFPAPLYYQSIDDGNKKDWVAFPLFYWGKELAARKKYFTFFPFYFSSSDKDGYFFNIAGLIHSQKKLGDRSNYILNTFWGKTDKSSYFHFFPLYFSYRSKEENYTNIAGLLYHNSNGANSTIFWFLFPLYFHYKTDKFQEIDYKTVLFLFHRYKKGESALHAGPLYYFFREKDNKNVNYLVNTFWGKDKTEQSSWFHFVPLYFQFKEQDQLKQLWALPIFFYKRDSYRHILPLYFSSKTENSQYSLLLPFYAKWKNDSHSDHSFLTLIWYFHRVKKENEDIKSTFSLFPLLPFFYTHTENNSTHRNFLYLTDWSKDEEGLKRFWFLPLAFYERDAYFHLFPFYFRSFDASGDIGISFSPIHYHRWSSEKENLWFLLHYSSRDKISGDHQWYLLPFYYNWQTGKEKGNIFLPFYANYEDETKQFHVNLAGVSTLYKQGVFQPNVGAGISSDLTEYYLDIDISWLYEVFHYSRRITKPFIDQKVNIEQKIQIPQNNRNVSLQTEPQSKLERRIRLDDKTEKNKEPAIRKKSDLSRENARDYTGISLLFGLGAYERADTKRHVRAVPLWWLTWDDKSADKLFVMPLPLPVVWYQSESTHYKVIFPLFGRQGENGSFLESWLIFGFIREYDAIEKKREYSLMWPLTNYYKSPVESGSRILPFYIYKNINKVDLKESRFYSLLYYSAYQEKSNVTLKKQMFPLILPLIFNREEKIIANDKSTRTKTSYIFPFWLNFYEEIVDSKTTSSSSKTFTLLYYNNSIITSTGQIAETIIFPLLFYKNETELNNYWNWFFIFDHNSSKKKDEIDSSFNIYPFYFYHRVKNDSIDSISRTLFFLYHHDFEKKMKKDEVEVSSTSFLLPFWLHFYDEKTTSGASSASSETFTLLYYKSKVKSAIENTEKTIIFPLFFYRNETELNNYWNWFFIFDHNSSKKKDEIDSSFNIYPFYFYHRVKNDSIDSISRTLFFLYHHESKKTSDSEFFHNNFFWFIDYRQDKLKQTDALYIFPLYSHYSTARKDFRENTFSIFYLFKTKYISRKKEGVEIFNHRLTRFFPLFYHIRDNNIENGVQKHERTHFNFLGLFHIYRKKDTLRNIVLFPLFYYGDRGQTWFIGGLYIRNTQNEKRANFLYLIDYQSIAYANKKRLNLFLGTIHFETSPQKIAFRLFYGLVSDFEKQEDSYKYRVLWLGITKEKNNFTANFIPFYYQSKKGVERKYIVPPLLTYISKDDNSGLELGGIGLLWYRQYNRSDGEDSKRLLLGILYAEKHHKVRGYTSYSSLGGVLFNYQKEEETGFSKFDVLMLFGRSKKDGKTRYKIFGVKI